MDMRTLAGGDENSGNDLYGPNFVEGCMDALRQ
jgi:hypothetical protein